MTIRSVILDMDGTLLDSMPIWHEIDIRFFEENGLTYPEGLSEQVNKMSMEEWAEFFVREFDIAHNTPETVIRRIEEMAAEYYTERIPLKPFVTEFLDHLDAKAIPYGVATATYRSSASAALQRLGILQRMRFLLTAEDVPGGKTTPAMYQRAAAMLGTAPAETLIVEDALHCVQMAVQCGFPVAAVHDASCPPAEWAEICRLTPLHGESLREIMPAAAGAGQETVSITDFVQT